MPGLLFDDLLRRAEERNRRSQAQKTLLMRAVEVGQVDEVRRLLDAGVDVNARTESGYTALYAAAGNHRDGPPLIRLLLARGADPSLGTGGETPLHGAATLDHVLCAEALLDGGVDINAREPEFGMTPLMQALEDDCCGGFMSPNVARLLIARGADVTVADAEGRTVLDYVMGFYEGWYACFSEGGSKRLPQSALDLIESVRRAVAG